MDKSKLDLVKDYFEKFLSGNKDEAFELLDENVKWTVKGSKDVPTVGQRKGKAEVDEFFDKFQQTFEPKQFNINHYFVKEELVFAIGELTHLIKDSQRLVSSDWMIEFRVKNNKITSYKILEDSYALHLAFQK